MKVKIILAAAAIAISAAQALAAKDRTLMLSNSAGQAITAFKVTPVDDSAASIDVIAGQQLAPNGNRQVTIPSTTDTCNFDLEIAFTDGSVEKREAVDFCNTDGFIVEK
jgi:hypothetical protein